jgi:hypothetical protein
LYPMTDTSVASISMRRIRTTRTLSFKWHLSGWLSQGAII